MAIDIQGNRDRILTELRFGDWHQIYNSREGDTPKERCATGVISEVLCQQTYASNSYIANLLGMDDLDLMNVEVKNDLHESFADIADYLEQTWKESRPHS